MICIAQQILRGDEIKKNKMGAACGIHGGEEKRMQSCGGET